MDTKNQLRPVIFQLQQSDYEEADISLRELLGLLMQRKTLVFLVTSLVTLIALAFAFVSPPEYEAISYLEAVSGSDIAPLTTADDKLDTDKVHQRFVKTFKSRAVRLSFYKQVGPFQDVDEANQDVTAMMDSFEKLFHEKLSIIEVSGKFGQDSLIAKFRANDPVFAADILNKFIEYAAANSIASVKQDVVSKMSGRLNSLLTEIELAKLTGKKEKRDRIARLEEALQIAKQLENNKSSNRETSPVNLLATNTGKENQDMLYIRGAAALSAELASIKSRKEDDAFVPDLRELEQDMALVAANIETISEDQELKSIKIDQVATAPQYRSKPNRKLILLTGFLAGLGLSILLVISLSYFSTSPEKEN